MDEPRRGDDTGRLADVLQDLWQRRPVERPGRPTFKLPKYDGRTDVDLFIQRFEEISQANEWEEGEASLHLKQALVDGANECSRPYNVEGILTTLRARYGMTPREARSRLTTLRKDYKTTLQEHGTEVERLVNTAYPGHSDRQRAEMSLDQFITTLGHMALQGHLLAVAPETIEHGIRAGNAYLQLQKTQARGRHYAIQEAEDLEEETPPTVAPVVSRTVDPVVQAVAELTKMMTLLAKQMTALQSTTTSAGPRLPDGREQPRRPIATCWGCGQPGHLRRNCPRQGPALPNRQAGNDYRPQQQLSLLPVDDQLD